MALLLDTHVALWFWQGDPKLRTAPRQQIEEEEDVYFSQCSTWEIQIKWGLSKLSLRAEPGVLIPEAIQRSRFQYLRVEDEAIFFLGKLPDTHRDPFDRLLAAQAAVNGMTLVSADPIFARYPVKVLRADLD